MKINLHIPIQQYGFVEATDVDPADVERIYNQYAEKSISLKSGGFVTVQTFTGEQIQYNKDTHEYRDMQDNKLLGGSAYAKQFEIKPFNAEIMLPVCAKAWGVDESIIADIWEMNKDTSNLLGSAIHLGLQLAHKHAKSGAIICENKKDQVGNYALPKSPIVRKAVLAFIREYGLDALPEVFVSDVANKRVGQIDRLITTGDKTCRVQDYKTSLPEPDKILVYQHQLSYYASCLTKAGWTVEGLDLYFYDGDKWTKKSLKVLEVK